MTKAQRSILFSVVVSFALVGLGCGKEGLSSGGTGGSGAGGVTGAGGLVAAGGASGTGSSFGTGGVAAGGTSGGPGGAITTVPATCTVGDKTYRVGEGFKLDCNTCTCTNTGVACTAMACIPDAGADAPAIDAGPAPDSRVVCTYNGTTMLPGESVFDGCNTCSCGNNGTMMCTARACPVEDAAPATDGGLVSCPLSSNLTFGYSGGMVIYQDENRLTATTFTITRGYMRGTRPDGASGSSCSPKLPACGAAGVVSVATINTDLADADVQGAFKTAQSSGTLYGSDPRPVDGTVYSIALEDGRTLLVGMQCASPVMSSCRTIPAGLVKLVEDLMSLAEAMAADPACKGL